MTTQASGYFVLTPRINEIVVGMAVFAMLYVLLSRVVVPRLEGIYEQRRIRIDGGFERAEQARAEARRAREEYRVRIGQARDEATRIRDAAREEGQRQADEVLATAREESGQSVSEGRGRLDEQRARLRSDLQPDIARLSRDLAGRILGRRVGDDEHRSTVDEYLAQRSRESV